MASSSGTTVVARDDMIDAARSMIMTNLWHYERHGEFPTLTQMAQRDSWRGAAIRKEAREFLIDEDYMSVDGDRRGDVTPKGLKWITAPSIEAQADPEWIDLPGEADEYDVFAFVENFYDRRNQWPNPEQLKGAGVRKRLGTDTFNSVLDALIDRGEIARITLRNGDKWVTFTIALRWCPWLRGKHGQTYWWPSSNGPLPI